MHTTRASLLLRIRDRGDSIAWGEFDAIYRPMLRRFAASQGLSDAEADDVVQHCMAAIAERISAFDYDPRKGRFKGWLRTLVNNRVRNLWRDRREQSAKTGDFERDQARERTPEEAFDDIWMQEHLRYCLNSLRKEMQESTMRAFQAYVIDEKPIEVVCKEIGMSEQQVYQIKWRVTQKLSEMMKALTEGEE